MTKKAETREGMIVTTVALPEDLHKELRIIGVEEGRAFTDIVRTVLSEWVARRERRKGRRKS